MNVTNSPKDPKRPATGPTVGELTNGRRITRNSLLNIAGYCTPILVAIMTVPTIIHEMGTERFGILTLAWAIIGYFSLFDFGLNRALTKLVSERLGNGNTGEIPDLIWTSLVIMGTLGCLAAGFMMLFLPWLAQSVLTIPAQLERESLITFYLLASAVPIVIISVGLRGVMSAYQKFDLINMIRVPMGIYFFVVPVPIIKWYANALHPVMVALVVGRLVALLIQLRLCNKIVLFMRPGAKFQRNLVRPLLTFGGWVTVSNLIAPLMIYIDRFFIGALLSASAVAFYATPNEVATKLWFLPWALLGVLFPAFSTSLAERSQLTAEIYNNSVKYLYITMFPIALFLVGFAFEALNIWVGPEFAGQSTLILKWMVVGVYMHSLAQVPYALLQGGGRPDIIAKLHMVELPIYCFLLWQLIGWWGTQGAAITWTIRLSIDALIVFRFAWTILPASADKVWHKLGLLLFALGSFFLVSNLEKLIYRCGAFFSIMTIFTLLVWFIIFNQQDRNKIHKGLFHAV